MTMIQINPDYRDPDDLYRTITAFKVTNMIVKEKPGKVRVRLEMMVINHLQSLRFF